MSHLPELGNGRRSLRIGSVVAVIALALMACTPSSPVPATEQTIRVGGPWCQNGCLTLAEWPGLVSDGRLLGALIVAYQYPPEWRSVAQLAARRGTRVTLGPESSDYGGYYQVATNTIVMASNMLSQPMPVLAALLGHEVTQAANGDGRGTVAVRPRQLRRPRWCLARPTVA